jgi:hypothetical protein
MDYAELLATAQELIADAGRVVTFERLAAGAPSAAQPWKGAGTPTVEASAQAAAVFVPVSGHDLGGLAVSKELLARCEEVCMTAPAGDGFDMQRCTSIADGGTRWRVTWVQTLKPGDTVVLYALGVAR